MTQDNLGGAPEPLGRARFNLGRVLAESFSILLRNFVPFMIIAVVIAIPSLLIEYWQRTAPAGPAASVPASLIAGLIGLLTAALTQSALTYGTLQDMRGQRAGLGECISRGLASTPKVAMAAVLWSILVGVGMLLLIVPGIIMMVAFWVYVPAIVVENAGVSECFGRSRTLTRGHRLSIFGLFALVAIVVFGLEFWVISQVDIVELAATMNTGWMPWVISAVSILITAYAAVMTSVGYYYLRAEKEGALIDDDIAKVFD
jgi:hypothetical protein